MLDDNGQPVTEFVNATIYEQVNDENDNPVEYYVDMAAFNDGDILRAQDSATTYQIGEMVPLQGVYCINKGYAVFRKIQIIDQNAEYSIIKKQTQYRLRSMIILWKMHPPSVKKILCIKYWRLERYAEREL